MICCFKFLCYAIGGPRLSPHSRIRDANLIITLQRAKRPVALMLLPSEAAQFSLYFTSSILTSLGSFWPIFIAADHSINFLSRCTFFVPMIFFFVFNAFRDYGKNILVGFWNKAATLPVKWWLHRIMCLVAGVVVISQSLWSCSSILLTWSAFRNTTLLWQWNSQGLGKIFQMRPYPFCDSSFQSVQR